MRGRDVALAACLVAGSIAGAMYLMDAQFSSGSAYPQYSSLRSDPEGAKLLFDTLALIPGERVSRNYLPPEYLSGRDAAVFLLNVNAESWSEDQLTQLDSLAARGNRIVASMAEVRAAPDNSGALAKKWKIRLGFHPDAPRGLKLYFAGATGWQDIAGDRAKTVAIERSVGKGSEVLFADSSPFANQAVADMPGTAADSFAPIFAPIEAAVGPYSRVVFDEEHFGITQTGSVVGLVRRFRLTGMALGLAICAALFVWRSVTAFPPAESARENVNAGSSGRAVSGRTSRSGLLTLLRRHVPPAELASVCWYEWLAANRGGLAVEAAAQADRVARSKTNPVEAMREIRSIVNSKGTL